MRRRRFRYQDTLAWLRLLAQGGMLEYRSIDAKGRIASGYFRDMETLAAEVAARHDDPAVKGHYVTLNRPLEAVWSRGPEQVVEQPKETTKDHEIERRVWMLVDLDVTRPSGVSSTDLELKVAARFAKQIFRTMTREHGWPKPVVANSGNGAHLLWRIDLPNDTASQDAIVAVLSKMDREFGSEVVKVDQSVYNAARITKLYGTRVRKGFDTEERPHRLSRIVSMPEPLESLTLEQMREWAPPHVAVPRSTRNRPVSLTAAGSSTRELDLEQWLDRHRVGYREKGGRYHLEGGCPFESDSTHDKAAVWVSDEGPRFHCFGGRCSERHWSDFRAYHDPEYAGRRRSFS